MNVDEQENPLLKAWKVQLSRGLLEFLVLVLLENKRHGYDILQTIRSLFPRSEPPLSDGTIYNILTRLKSKDLVSMETVLFEGRMRRYYCLTKKGKQLQQEMIDEWTNLNSSVIKALEMYSLI